MPSPSGFLKRLADRVIDKGIDASIDAAARRVEKGRGKQPVTSLPMKRLGVWKDRVHQGYIELTGTPLVLKRSDLDSTDTTISHLRHVQFYSHGEQFYVADLNSKNGTFVNGQRLLEPHLLQPGDRIQVGRTILVFDPEGEPAASAASRIPSSANHPDLRLVVQEGPNKGQAFDLEDMMTLGRAPEVDISLGDPQVSRRHAVIQRTSDGYMLRDAGSQNGTFVNEERVTAARTLRAGDRIRTGGTVLVVKEDESRRRRDRRDQRDQRQHRPRVSSKALATTGVSGVIAGGIFLFAFLHPLQPNQAVTATTSTPTQTPLRTEVLTVTNTPFMPAIVSSTPLPTLTPTPLPTALPSPTDTPLPTFTYTWTPSPTSTPRPTFTRTSTPTLTPTFTATPCSRPAIDDFHASSTTITRGQKSTLSWGLVSNANSAFIDPDIGGVATPGQEDVNPNQTTTYTLAAVGCGGKTSRSVTITVIQYGNITGHVYDQSGYPISGAEVDLNGGYSAVTDSRGKFFITDVPQGNDYALTASASGYENASFYNLKVVAGRTTNVPDITLYPPSNYGSPPACLLLCP